MELRNSFVTALRPLIRKAEDLLENFVKLRHLWLAMKMKLKQSIT
jgi:hypothetical protein